MIGQLCQDANDCRGRGIIVASADWLGGSAGGCAEVALPIPLALTREMSITRLGKVVPKTSILFLCDMQEKFRPTVAYFPQIVAVAARMLQSTALDLLERGLDVHVVADACSSRSQLDRLVAFTRLRQSGAFLTTSEGLVLQLVQDAAHPHFRQIQKIIKEPAPDSGLLPFFQAQNPLGN
ncbi:isochorismatase domain-containing protein 2 isoform X2 [Alligator mississippiensis]|uniref:isochorismatase domain-containing protein 2 isoform X2 n=1 Tax=Alligator mississippiensis TaxID=8496 RepID=UPI002877E2D8|nr:isochorismatase domain-containing protein 2 isoform X2 [Alligator mississippiensis]